MAERPSTDHVDVGPLTVFFPTGGEPTFWFLHDLAGLFGVETNAEAEGKLRAALRERPKGRLSFDHEADAVSVNASNAELMEHVLATLRGLCVDPEALPSSAIAEAGVRMRAAPRPKKQRWKVGDLFAVPLADGTWALGHIVDSPGPRLGMTQALYDVRVPEPVLPPERVEEVVTARTLTILHTTSADVEDGTFRVVGAGPVLVDPASGPLGPRDAGSSWDGLATVAAAWWGLYPWNAFFDADFLDKRLMRGVKRPEGAWMLSEEERVRVREDARGKVLGAWIAERLQGRRPTPAPVPDRS